VGAVVEDFAAGLTVLRWGPGVSRSAADWWCSVGKGRRTGAGRVTIMAMAGSGVRGAGSNVEPGWIERVRQVLAAAGFAQASVVRRLEADEAIRIEDRAIPRLLRMTASGTSLDALIRLFVFGVPVAVRAVERALAPMTVAEWVAGGLLQPPMGDTVVAALRLIPHGGFLLCSDPVPRRADREAAADSVPGSGQHLPAACHGATGG
jgi:hypothetical protein